MVFSPSDPSRLGSCRLSTPETMVANTSGMTIIWIRRTNRSPIHLICTAPSPQIRPAIPPSTRATRMRFHSLMPNQ